MSTTRSRRERGAAAVEMAIVLPLLLLTLGGIVDLGRAFFIQVVLTNAAREGVRAATVMTTGTPDAAIKTRAIAAANGVNGATATVVSNCVPPLPPAVLPANARAEVKVEVTMDWFFLDAFGVNLPSKLTRNAVMGCT
jgi:Flp pilus assembly protein TadG